jgi:glutathione synthase/RimK-type ligase-like ATP-grasp enzyme
VILVVGDPKEPVAALVLGRLREANLQFHVLDIDREQLWVHAEWNSGNLAAGYFAGPGWRAEFEALTGVFIRFGAPASAPASSGPDHASRDATGVERMGLVWTVLDALACTVINKLLGGMSNMSKPHQSLIIRDCGLAVPNTLVTNDPIAAGAFIDKYEGAVITKSISGIRSVVRQVGPAHRARLSLLRHGPAQFQELIAGTDIRVHVVGDRCFATRIESAAVDYRYAPLEGGNVKMTRTTLPESIETTCLEVVRRLDLVLAGIDLKLTPHGEYICFEVNPAPAFIAYEAATRQAISIAVVEALAGSPRSMPSP